MIPGVAALGFRRSVSDLGLRLNLKRAGFQDLDS